MRVKSSSAPYFSFRMGVTTAVRNVSACGERPGKPIRDHPGERHGVEGLQCPYRSQTHGEEATQAEQGQEHVMPCPFDPRQPGSLTNRGVLAPRPLLAVTQSISSPAGAARNGACPVVDFSCLQPGDVAAFLPRGAPWCIISAWVLSGLPLLRGCCHQRCPALAGSSLRCSRASGGQDLCDNARFFGVMGSPPCCLHLGQPRHPARLSHRAGTSLVSCPPSPQAAPPGPPVFLKGLDGSQNIPAQHPTKPLTRLV